MVVNSVLFKLENCMVEVNIDYSTLLSFLPAQNRGKDQNVFDAIRSLRRSLSKKKYSSLLEQFSLKVDELEMMAGNSSKLLFDPSGVVAEMRKRGVLVAVFSLLGDKAVTNILEKHGLVGCFDGKVTRLRVDQPTNFVFPLRVAKKLVKDKGDGDMLLCCSDAETIHKVKTASVPGVKVVALPVKTKEIRNIILAKPDAFVANLGELLDLIDFGLV